MPEGHGIQRGQGEGGLAEVEEYRLRESLFAEGRQRYGIGEVHGIDAANGEQESALRRAGEMQRSGDRPGGEHERERQEAGSQRYFPSGRREGHAIQRHENRGRETDGKDEEAQPFRMLFRQQAGEAQQCAGDEEDEEGLEGGGHGAESSRKRGAGGGTHLPEWGCRRGSRTHLPDRSFRAAPGGSLLEFPPPRSRGSGQFQLSFPAPPRWMPRSSGQARNPRRHPLVGAR